MSSLLAGLARRNAINLIPGALFSQQLEGKLLYGVPIILPPGYQGLSSQGLPDVDHEIISLTRDAINAHSTNVQGRGTATPEALTAALMASYRSLPPQRKPAFFRALCNDFGVQVAEVDAATQAWKQASERAADAQSEAMRYKAADRLRQACEPLHSRLLLPISQQRQGVKFLIDLRADLLAVIADQPAYNAPLRALNDDLRRILAEWFSVGLLQLEQLSWERSSAALLQKVMRYEAVHRMQSWDDLHQRLGPGRRVFCFFHPSVPDEPLVVLHTALMGHAASGLHEILERPAASLDQAAPHPPGSSPGADETEAAVAVFYSISSTQKGLAGVDLGNFLIKQVVERLKSELPQLEELVTLSPLPNFRSWLTTQLGQDASLDLQQQRQQEELLLLVPEEFEPLTTPVSTTHPLGAGTATSAVVPPGPQGRPLITAAQGKELLQAVQRLGPAGAAAEAAAGGGAAALLLHVLRDDLLWRRSELEPLLQPLLMSLGARYLSQERRRNQALDPVANFHLRNGAWLWRLNWGADTSPAGLQRSFGVMVNYKYVLSDVFSNHQRYALDHGITTSPHVLQLL